MEIISVTMEKEIHVEVSMAAKEVVSADLTLINQAIDDLNGEIIAGQALDKLAATEATKADLKAMVISKGVNMQADLKLADYPSRIAQIGDKYVRPSFWPELPEIAVDGNGEPTEHVLYLLLAVFPDNQTYIKFYQISPDVTINWGDGTIEEHTAAINSISHTYSNFAAVPGAINERGYKCAVIEVRPRFGQPLNYTYLEASLLGITSLLEVRIAMNNISTAGLLMLFSHQPMLEIFKLVGKPKGLQFHGVGRGPCSSCGSLAQVEFDTRDMELMLLALGGQTVVPAIVRLDNSYNARLALYNSQDTKSIQIIGPKRPCIADHLLAYAFFKEVVFDDMSNFTDLTNAFIGMPLLTRLVIPNTQVSTSCSNSRLGFAELKRIIEEDLSPNVISKTFTISGAIGAAEVMSAISAGTLIVPAGWEIAN